MEYYKNHLEGYNEDFKNQLQEFKEGNVLFEIMERNVWSPAASDSINQLKLYQINKTNYKWAESADVLIVSCNTTKIAEDAMKSLKAGQNWRTLMELQQNEIQVDSGRYELAQIVTENNNERINENSFSSITKNADGSASFTKYLNVYPAGDQRNFEESRGLVINDYQNMLEQKWVEGLRKKYPVKVNEVVLKTLMK